MANRKAGRGGGGGGGFKGGILAGVSLLMVGGFVFGWAQANSITGVDGVLDYFRTWSKDVESCGISDLEWTCDTPITGYEKNGAPGEGEAPAAPETPSASLALLEGIPVAAAEEVPYERSEWKHWSDLDGDGCNTREQILKETGTNVVADPGSCKIQSGTWLEPYALTEVTDSSKLDIDHVLALSAAAQNGGQRLSAADKEALANDPDNVFISIAKENRSKGDKTLSEYMPPNEAFHCDYVTSYVTVVDRYGLTMAQADKAVAQRVLENAC